MWCAVILCDVMWCDVMRCAVMWCNAIWCDIMWYVVMWCYVMCCEVTLRDVCYDVLCVISSPNYQGMRRDHLSVHRFVVQRIHEECRCTRSAKRSTYIVTAQEAYTWQKRYQQLQAILQSICTIDIIGEGNVQAASELSWRQQSYTAKPSYRRNLSTESALMKVCSDIKSAIDNGNLVLLLLMDLLAAFDCVDHEILLNRLGHSFGIQSKDLKWLTSHLTGRTQCVHLSEKNLFVETMQYGVPQGSVLVPLIFLLYTADSNATVITFLCKPLPTLLLLSTRWHTISPRNNACLHIRYWPVDVI